MRRLSRWIMTIALILIGVVGILAIIDNSSRVALHFLEWATPELSIYWWLVGAFACGVAVGWLGAGVQVLRARAGSRQLRRDLSRSQAELSRSQADLSRSKSVDIEVKAIGADG
jgi:uncharacterized membrane protein YciS (DUF1049 family)